MADNSYKMELGIKLDTSDLQTQVNAAGDGIKPIEIKVDAETKELTNTIKEALKSLSSGTKNALTLDTTKLEASLNDVTSTIREIKTAIGTLGSGSNMKSLVSSINSISTALDRASDKFDGLLADLKSLSGKDFNLNFGITMGGSNPIGRNAAYGSKVRNETLPQLKQQMSELVKYYNSTYKSSLSEFEVLQRMVSGTKLGTGDFFENFLFGKDSVASRMNGGSLASQMQAHKEYIDMFKQAASLRGLDLTPVTSNFSKTADDLITDAQNIQTGANEMQDGFEKLKQVFGGNSINVEGISTQLDSIVVDLGEIKTTIQGLSSGVSLDGLAQSFDKLSNSIELLVKNCGNMKTAINDSVGGLGGSVGKSGSGLKNIENDLKQVTVTADNTSDAIQSMRNAMSSMKFNTSSIDAATKDLEEMNVTIKEVTAKQDKNFDITVKGINEAKEAVTIIKRFNEETRNFDIVSTKISKPFDTGVEAAKRFKKEAETVKNIKFDIDVGNFENEIDEMYAKFNRLSNANDDLRNSVDAVKNAYKAMLDAAESNTGDEVADRERLIRAEKEYAAALEKTNNLIKKQARADKIDADRIKLQDNRDIFQSKIDTWLTKNSAATKQFGNAMLKLKAQAESCDQVTLNHLEKQFKKLDTVADKAGLKVESLGDRIKSKFKEYSAYLSVAEVFMYISQGMQDMFEQVKLIDSAMTELKKVTNETDASYNQFLSNAASRAKAIGTTIDGLVTSTADFARLGYGFKESQELAEVANIYAVVGDEIDGVEGATESLISTMTAFGIEASNSMSIVDKFNIIGNNFAISSGGIGEALERSASSMAAANNSLDETIALITAANTVVQDPASVGQAFKTISMRIRGAKTEMEEAGLETDGMAESTAKLRSEIMALSGVDIMLDSTTFKSTYQIMEELATKWQDLTDIQQASITELIAGKRQGNIVSSLMMNFDIAQSALQTSLDSSGSAMEEHGKYMDSIEAKLSQLKSAWQGFAQTFMNSDLLKGGIDVLKTIIDFLEKLIDNFGLLGTIGLGTGITGLVQYFRFLKNDGVAAVKTITDVVNAINNLSNAMSNASNVAETTGDVVEAIGDTTEAIGGTVEVVGGGAKVISNTVETTSDIASAVGNSAEAVGDMVEAAGDGVEAMTDLGGVVTKTGGSLKAFMKTPMGVASAIGIAVAAIGLLYNAYKNAKEAAAEARQEAIESSDAYLDAASSFERAYIKYSGRTDLTSSEEEELKAAIHGTVDALGDKSSALQSAVNSSNDYLTSLEAIKRAELEATKTAAETKRDKAEEALREAAIGWESFDGSEVNIKLHSADKEAQRIAKEMGSEFVETSIVSIARSPKAVEDVTLRLSGEASTEEIIKYYNFLQDYKKELESAKDSGLDVSNTYDQVNAAIEKMSESISVYTDGVYEAVKANYQFSEGIPKTAEAYIAMREAIIADGELSEFSLDKKMSILNSLDSEYGQLFDLTTAEVQARKFVGIIKGYGDGTKDGTNEIGAVETFLNMRTAVNNNECSVGEYLSQFNKIDEMTEGWSDEEKELLNTSFGLDTDTIKHQYEKMQSFLRRQIDSPSIPMPNPIGVGAPSGVGAPRIGATVTKAVTKDNGVDIEEINRNVERAKLNIDYFLDSLTADELTALIDIRTEIDWQNTSAEDIRKQIEDQAEFLKAMNFTIAIDVEAESIESLNTAMAESVSGAGLSSDSITALKSRYSDLASQGYDLSAMFEETSNGIHLNKNAVSEFEQVLASNKLAETDGHLEVLKGRYDDLTKEIKNCADAGERANLYSEQQEVAQKINDLATLTSQYKGLASAYNAWQNAESAGSERNMYESIIEGFETVGDEISRGWYDDGTIKFLELITGETDLASKSASELKKIWKGLDDTIEGTSYSVKDFFTTDEDGNSTSTGAYNFLRAVEELGKNGTLKALEGKNLDDLVKRKGKKIVGFDFDVVGGDKAIADALGVSEEMVQIIQRALDDAGFVVTLDGKYTLLADLKTSAEESNNALKKLKSQGLESLKDVDLNFDFNVDTVEGYQEQLEKATAVLDKFRDKNGKLKTDSKGNLVEGAQEALEIAEYYTAAMDKLTEPKFMQIDTSAVDEELQDPIEKMQKIGDLCKEKHLVSLTGDTEDLKEVQGEIDKIAEELANIEDEEIKKEIGIDPKWDSKTIADKIEKGEIEIPAELKLDVQMSKDLKDMRLMMMRELGLVSENEVKLKIGYEIDDSAVDKLSDKEQEVIVKYIEENEEVWNKYSEEEKEAVVKIVADGTDIEEWEAEEKEALVKYVVDGGDIDDWSPEAKEAFAKYIVDGGDIDKFDPDDKESWVVYKKDSTEPDSYIADDEEASVVYKKDSIIPDSYIPEDPDATVKYDKDSLIPDSYIPLDPPATVIFDKDTSAVDSYNPPDIFRTVYYTIKETISKVASGGKKKAAQRTGADISPVNGTANVNGTAFKQGSWGTKGSGTALVGELGREVLVRDGKYYTIGDNGAEFIKYKKGDIIFNHVQSEELFKNGKVTSGGGRAKAFVDGTALVEGVAFGNGAGGGEEPNPDDSGNDKFEDTIDWIETILERAERAIDKYEKQADNVYKTWAKRNKALENEIAEVNSTISLYEQAKNKYLSEANAVGLSESYASKVRNGSLSIQDFEGESDEKLVEKIKNYQDLYNKYLDCVDKIDELKEKEASLYSQRFDNVQSEYDNLLQGFDHTQSMLDEYISQAEAKGQIVSKNYYAALIDNEESRINTLKQEQVALIKARDEAVANNEFDKYSEDWYDMCSQIDDVTQAIEAGTTSLIEYNNAIRDIDWEVFDLIQQRITDITDEADFLIELMSNKDLFDDNGKFTKQGTATIGLHAQNYNTYMYQADLAGEEAAKLKQQLAANPYDTTNLEEQYRQRIAEQREYILAAEDAKNAIIDLVENGIELELEALDEQIQKYQDALDSQKDLRIMQLYDCINSLVRYISKEYSVSL